MSQGFSQQQRRVTAVFYLILGLGMALLASQVYLSGYYQAILLPALLTPILLGSGLIRWQAASHFRYDPAALLVVIMLGLFLLLQPETLARFTHWQLASFFYPLIAFYLLPSPISLLLSLLLLAGLFSLRLQDASLAEQLLFSLQYLLLLGLAWFYNLSSWLETHKLEQMTGQDAVTRLQNAEHLHTRLQAEVSRARATQRPLSFLLIELHQYPRIVEELGASRGQRFIYEAGQVTFKTCRTGDEAYRLDDLTLLLLLPNTTLNGALVLRERLYQQLLHQVVCELGPIDASITPLTLTPGERAEDLWQRLEASCYHFLSERVSDQLDS